MAATVEIPKTVFPALEASYAGQLGISSIAALTSDINGSLQQRALGTVELYEIAVPPISLSVDGTAPQSGDFLWIGLMKAGTASLRHDGQELSWNEGDLIIYGGDQQYTCTSQQRSDVIFFQIPLAPLRNSLPRDIVGELQHRNSNAALTSLIADILRSTCLHARQLEAEGTNVIATLLTLLAGTLGVAAHDALATLGDRHTLWSRICRHIEHNLFRHDLTVSAVATAHGISHRYLNKIFAMHGWTAVGYIRRQRLERCRTALRNSSTSSCSITEIAFAHGFESSSSFTHAYKKEFGLTPGEDRRAAQKTKALPAA